MGWYIARASPGQGPLRNNEVVRFDGVEEKGREFNEPPQIRRTGVGFGS